MAEPDGPPGGVGPGAGTGGERERRRGFTVRGRRSAGALLVLACLAGCATHAAQATSPSSPPAPRSQPSPPSPPSGAASSRPGPGVRPVGTSPVVVRLTPSSGPVGTVVRVRASGCEDNAGDVSFHSDANDLSARNDVRLVHLVTAVRTGDQVTGTYQVTRQDLTGGEGLFFVQCGASLGQAPFLVTGPVPATGQCPLLEEPVSEADGPAAFDAAVAYATGLDPTLSSGRVREDTVRSASSDLRGRGGEVQARCGADTAGRTLVVTTTRTDLLPSASLATSVYFVSRVGGRLWVWQQAH